MPVRPVKRALSIALLALALSDARAEEPVSAARLRRLAAAGWWPAGVSAELESGGLTRPRRAAPVAADALSGARMDHALSGGAQPITGPLPAAIAAAAAQQELTRAVRAVETGIRDQNGLAIELHQATGDYVRITLSKDRRALLEPYLLYLVEKGVIASAEVAGLLAAEDPAELLVRLRARIEQVHEKRGGLEVQRYYMLERLERAVGAR